MKYFLYAFALVILVSGCQKAEKETAPVAKTEQPEGRYPDFAVGHNSNGVISVENSKQIIAQWQAYAAGRHITSLEIVKAKTTDESHTDFYMMRAKTKEGTVMLGTLLSQVKDTFYFDPDCQVITSCQGTCDAGCAINGINHGGHVKLYCGDCTTCEKTEGAL